MAVYECVLEAKQGDSDMLTVLHYDLSSGATVDIQDFVDTFGAILDLDLKPQLLSTVVVTGMTIRPDSPGAIGVSYPFTAGDITGTGAGTDGMHQAAMLIRKVSTSLVRPNRGRIYQGGLSVGALGITGFWDATVRDAVVGFWESVRELSFGTGQTGFMVIKASKPENPNTQAYSTVTSIQGLLSPVTQRRRRIGVGS